MPSTLWIEGVTPSTALNDVALSLSVNPPGCSVTTNLTVFDVDLDVDSDNNDGLAQPERSDAEDSMENVADAPTNPGKIIFANRGDPDLNGVPGYSDGFDLSGPATNNTASGFAPLVLGMGPVVDANAATITFTYDASDPASVTVNNDTYTAAPGQLRIWRKDGSAARLKAPVNAGGDFIAPGVSYTLQELGLGSGQGTGTLYVEGIHASSDTGGAIITATVDLDGNGPLPPSSDTVRFSVLDSAWTSPDSETSVQVTELIKDSHAAPWFTNFSVALTSPVASLDGSNLLATLTVTGIVRSDMCDLVAGPNGTVPFVRVLVNGEVVGPTTNGIEVTVSKGEQDSFTRPYPFEGTFTWQAQVVVSTGQNWIKLAASDEIPGVGLTGFAEFIASITAETNTTTYATQSTGQSVPPGPYLGWNYTVSSTAPHIQSGRGKANPHYVQIQGPPVLLDHLAVSSGYKIAIGPDANYYAADDQGKPAAQLAIVGIYKREIIAHLSPTFYAGFAKGFTLQGVDMVVGTAQFVVGAAQNYYAHAFLLLGINSEWAAERVLKFDDGLTEAGRIGKVMLDFAGAAAGGGVNVLEAASRGEWAEAYQLSEPARQMCLVGIEVMQKMVEEYSHLSAFEKGEVQGAIALELATVLIPATKLGAVSKAAALQKLETGLGNMPIFRDRFPGLLNALKTVRPAFAALPEFCFVAGTLVHTDRGLKAIEEIRAGDRVLARDEIYGHQTFKPVLATVVTHPDRLYHLKYRARQPHRHAEGTATQDDEGGDSGDGDDDPAQSELVCSGPHPFFVPSLGKFVPARELAPGHDFRLADGRTAILETVETEDAPEGELFTTYNFEVADYHTYFVGTEGVWVHNDGFDACKAIDTLTRTKIRNGLPRRQAIREAMIEAAPNVEMAKISERLKSAANFMLDELPDNPTAQQMADIFTVADWKALKQNKGILIERDGMSWKATHGAGDLRGHHIVVEAVQTRMQQLGVDIPSIDDSPVKVFTHAEHYGVGQNSLHNRMNAWDSGILHPNNLGNFQTKEALIDELLRFYTSDPSPDFVHMARATRGWAAKHTIPITR